MTTIRQFLSDESGATAIEYALILGLVAMAIVGSIGNLRDDVSALYNFIGGLFDQSINGGG